jgi:rRNA maturation endonuclease Nob1
MGFFNKLGRRLGKFEQEARAAAAEDANWGCANCGSTFVETPEACPDCGSERIVALGADEEAGETTDVDGKASGDDST